MSDQPHSEASSEQTLAIGSPNRPSPGATELQGNTQIAIIMVPSPQPPPLFQAALERPISEVIFYDPFANDTDPPGPDRHMRKLGRIRRTHKTRPEPGRKQEMRAQAIEAVCRELKDLASTRTSTRLR